ncbi:hypothetical protein [Actinopolymorpha pittospori]|uniref:hypothetical protein n=1 Tax=Actinopolymorpha pittospori TaxID=648752 RepID=UPI0031F02F6C
MTAAPDDAPLVVLVVDRLVVLVVDRLVVLVVDRLVVLVVDRLVVLVVDALVSVTVSDAPVALVALRAAAGMAGLAARSRRGTRVRRAAVAWRRCIPAVAAWPPLRLCRVGLAARRARVPRTRRRSHGSVPPGPVLDPVVSRVAPDVFVLLGSWVVSAVRHPCTLPGGPWYRYRRSRLVARWLTDLRGRRERTTTIAVLVPTDRLLAFAACPSC